MISVLPTSDGTHYVVTGGLTVGDVIVAKGAGYVKESQKVVHAPGVKRNIASSTAFR